MVLRFLTWFLLGFLPGSPWDTGPYGQSRADRGNGRFFWIFFRGTHTTGYLRSSERTASVQMNWGVGGAGGAGVAVQGPCWSDSLFMWTFLV